MSAAIVLYEQSSQLAKLEQARQMLAECRTLSEVKKIRDIAEAAKVYARTAHLGREAQNYAAEIAVRASRKAGEILKQMNKSKGGDAKHAAASVAGASEYAQTLKETDTPERTAEYWQQLAEVPPETVEKYLREKQETNSEITAAALLTAHRKTLPVRPRKYDELAWGEELDKALDHVFFCLSALHGRGPRQQEQKLATKVHALNEAITKFLETIN